MSEWDEGVRREHIHTFAHCVHAHTYAHWDRTHVHIHTYAHWDGTHAKRVHVYLTGVQSDLT